MLKPYRVVIVGEVYCSKCGIKFEMGGLKWITAFKVFEGRSWFVPMGAGHSLTSLVGDTSRIKEWKEE